MGDACGRRSSKKQRHCITTGAASAPASKLHARYATRRSDWPHAADIIKISFMWST